jgi:hypothetical protein
MRSPEVSCYQLYHVLEIKSVEMKNIFSFHGFFFLILFNSVFLNQA